MSQATLSWDWDGDQFELNRLDGGLSAVRDAELTDDVLDIALDGATPDDQPAGDLRIRAARRQAAQDLMLASSQPFET